MPNAQAPEIEIWVSHLKNLVGDPDEETYFVGHSVGCQAIIRYLESLEEGTKVGGAVFVGGWFTLSGDAMKTEEEKEVALPWLETPIDFEKAKRVTTNFAAVLSDNDPYVPLKDNKEIFQEKFSARVIIEHNKGHFSREDNITELPITLDLLLDMVYQKDKLGVDEETSS